MQASESSALAKLFTSVAAVSQPWYSLECLEEGQKWPMGSLSICGSWTLPEFQLGFCFLLAFRLKKKKRFTFSLKTYFYIVQECLCVQRIACGREVVLSTTWIQGLNSGYQSWWQESNH